MADPTPFVSDTELLRGLRARHEAAYAQLYAQHYPAIERHVRRNGGLATEAQDLFQETLLVLLARLSEPDFQLTSAFKTYVFAIASKLWLKRLRRNKHLIYTDFQTDPLARGEWPAEVEPDAAPEGLVRRLLARLTQRCRQLIRALFFGGKDIHQLTDELGYSSVHSAQNQKYKCLEQARRAR